MKTILHAKQTVAKLTLVMIVSLFFQQTVSAQALSFKTSAIEGNGAALAKGTTYRFSDVGANTDALVKIEDLVGGAQVTMMDHTGNGINGIGYDNAFQPEVYSPGGNGTSYALFSITFVQKGTSTPVVIGDFSATSLDIDGNNKLKEFSEVTITGPVGILSYLTQTVQIAVLPVLNGFKGTNVQGIEYAGIDTMALATMYTVTRTTVSTFDLKFGAVTTGNPSSTTRQYSLYMKDFSYTPITLPVKLESFTANLKNTNVDLKWTTATEINVSHFIVERSTDGANFSEAGMVFAFGNTTAKSDYAYSDNISALQAGIVYYRLCSVDIDGKTSYSEIRIIRIGKQSDNNVTILTYPNPVTNEVRITIPANWQNKKTTYEVYSINGQVAKKIEAANSSQTASINISSLNSGLYIVKVSCEGQTAQQKIVKQ